jgi:hypothetical protein
VGPAGQHDCKQRAEGDRDALGQTHTPLLPVRDPFGPNSYLVPPTGDAARTIDRRQVGGQEGRPAYNGCRTRVRRSGPTGCFN